ncbi:MAG: cation diffusion facilitator CzcD-associated flavoprotein CzcO [Gammaproteobacteria bacterium]|jgi:cation diffusion facilitator CzcD-associated flavoprotein CzcO
MGESREVNVQADNPRGLALLEEQVRHEIEIFRHNYQPWVPLPKTNGGQTVHDAIIVGGGLYGLGLAWGLMRAKVTNILVVDRAPAGKEGPWATFARMKTLRTAKQLTGIEFGIPSLSLRAYWEARFGHAAWHELERIPRVEWMQYLQWFRAVLEMPMSSDTKVLSIDGDAELARVTVQRNGQQDVLLARRVILATGLLGSGGPNIPADLIANLPAERWAHSTDEIDFARWQGADVGVLGAGASAFDNAIVALESGAAKVRQFCRRPELPWLNAKKGLENAGFMRHFADFPDLYRWRFVRPITQTPIPPPEHTVKRAMAMADFHLQLGSSWTASRMQGDKVVIVTPSAEYTFDFVIFGTGFDLDISRRPELTTLAPHILLWMDRFDPPTGEENDMLLRLPYLGAACEFREKVPGACPVLSRICLLGAAASLSTGPMFGGLNGVKFVLERVVDQTCRALMLESLDTVYDSFSAGLHAQKPLGTIGSTD